MNGIVEHVRCDDCSSVFIFAALTCVEGMDKMGESTKAGNKGYPGSPRDGAPVEITGLLKSTLKWLSELSSKGVISSKGVKVKRECRQVVPTMVSSDLIAQRTEKCERSATKLGTIFCWRISKSNITSPLVSSLTFHIGS